MKPLRVSEINNYIKKIFSQDILLPEVSIVGEISNLSKHYASGHVYFNLKDENSKIKCVMFKSYVQATDVELKEGLKVIASGNISIYEKDGIYQLYIKKIQRDGIGELYTAFEELKLKLQKEGLFDPSHKVPIPEYPKKIGIITSLTGAVIKDILRIIKRRFPPVNIVIYPSQVQGEKAIDQIIEGLLYLDSIDDIDTIILARGGGSIDELFIFNNERLARTIYNVHKPIISAVGHETDFTIADFVADLRAATPSEAAELAVKDMNTVLNDMEELRNHLIKTVSNILFLYKSNLQRTEKTLKFYNPQFILDDKKVELDNTVQRVVFNVYKRINDENTNLERLKIKLYSHDPEYVLERGYALITDESGTIITSVGSVVNDMNLKVNLKDGELNTEVKSVIARGNIRE
ncbi:exodeoxyribonuclease VII large subunit [Soehngenia saccharolytica]|nr:exodeoxyribonuclease VII large subunit [Soehngenia saccharolytica]